MNQDTARQRLKEAGFQVADQATPVNSSSPYGAVVGTSPDWSDGPRLDHHHPDQQRHPAGTAAAAAGCNSAAATGCAAAGNRLDGRRDPGPAADHRAGARAAAAAAATAVIRL